MTFSRQNDSFALDKPIAAFTEGIVRVHSLTLLKENVPPDYKGRRIVQAGMAIALVNGQVRPLPRTKTGAFSAGVSLLSAGIPQTFLPNDQLVAVQPFGVLTLSGSWTAGNTLQIATVGGGSIAALTIAGNTVISSVAENIASAANSHGFIGRLYRAAALGGQVYFFSRSGDPMPLLTFTASGGTATYAPVNDPSIGMVASTAFIGADTNAPSSTIALSSPTTVAMASLTPIGVLVDKIYGILEHTVDITTKDRIFISPISSADGVYKEALPYWDDTLATALPNIRFESKF